MTQPPSFSPEELVLLGDREFFRKKAIIGKKIRAILEALHLRLKPLVETQPFIAPENFDPQAFQFVKGEHLEESPYQYLDYPRNYSREEKLAFRSLAWWGHHFVFALIVEGDLVKTYRRHLFNRFSQVADQGLTLSLSPSLWEWKTGSGLTLGITSSQRSEIAAVLDHRTAFKLTRFIEFQDSIVTNNQIIEEGVKTFKAVLPIITP